MTERLRGLLFLSVGITACGAAPPTLPDAEVYRMALDAIAAELQLTPPTELHPFPLQLHRSDSAAGFSIGALNVFDSVAVPSVVARDSSYRLCALAPEGFCRRGPGGASLVLSEIQDLEQNGLGLMVLVYDERRGGTGHGYYNVRIKGGLGGWSVVELSRVSADAAHPISESARCRMTWRTDHLPGASGRPSCASVRPAAASPRASAVRSSTLSGSREPRSEDRHGRRPWQRFSMTSSSSRAPSGRLAAHVHGPLPSRARTSTSPITSTSTASRR